MSVRFVSRQRHVPEPQPRPEFVDHGKKFNLDHRGHDTVCDTQLHQMQPRDATVLSSSLATTRFHRGFQRNGAAQRDFYERTEGERQTQSARHCAGIEHNRAVYLSRRPEMLPSGAATGLAAIIAGGASASAPTAALLPSFSLSASARNVITGGGAAHPDGPAEAKSTARQFRLAQDARSPFDPPPALTLLRAVSDRRRDQVASEGLVATRRTQSTRTVLGSFDGFELQGMLPAIASGARKRRMFDRVR